MFKNMLKMNAAWAYALCVFGIAMMDHVLRSLKPELTATGNGRINSGELEKLQQYLSLKPIVELSLITVIAFFAFKLARPNGLRTNEYQLSMLVIASMSIGRSIFGIGEGFNTDFFWIALPGTLIGFLAYGFVRLGDSGL